MAALQAAVATAWADVKPASDTAVNALQGAIDTALAGSSAVVTAWMDAWYEQQYWAAVETNLAAGQSDKAWNDRYVELSKTSPAQATTNPVTMGVISNSSASSLTQAQTNLTTLTATKTTADALVASLKKRIEDSTKEIKALLALSDGKSTASAASTGAGAGVLDARYATARAAWSTWVQTAPTKGGEQLAKDDAAAALALVKASTKPPAGTAGYVAGGKTAVAKEEAESAWTKSQTAAKNAKDALTKVLTDAALKALRDDVTKQQGLW